MAGRITEEELDRLRSRIGVEWVDKEPYYNGQATVDAIRHFARGVGDDNPLWQDEAYASKTRWGGLIAPPTFLYSASGSSTGAGLPGLHGLHAGDEWTFYLPLRAGDAISKVSTLAEVTVKESAFSGQAVHKISEHRFTNQRGELVARLHSTNLSFERSGRGRNKYESASGPHYTPEELAAIYSDYDREIVRGSATRYWEGVDVGHELTPVVKGPLTVTDNIAWIMGRGSRFVRAHRIGLAYQRRHPAMAVVDPQTGIPDVPERAHWDEAMARSVGIPGAYAYGPQIISWVAHLLTNWMGDDGWLRRLHVQLRRPTYTGDTTWCRGKVLEKFQDGDDHIVRCEVWAENQRGERTAPGTADVVLPTR